MAFLVIHVGAGNHPESQKEDYKRLLRTALRSRSFVQSSAIIERSPLTNTGYGSSLDRFGKASCDCTLVQSTDGAVDVLSLLGVDDKTSPTRECVQVKKKIDDEFSSVDKLGLSKPTVLQYEKIRDQFGTGESSSLVSSNSKALYEKYKNVTSAPIESIQDTIGVLHWDKKLSMATSSGGTFLKFPGRVSCAGIYGSGIAHIEMENLSISCMCSGNGDDIIKIRLASIVADNLLQSHKKEKWPEYPKVIVDSIIEQSRHASLSGLNDKSEPIIYVGVLAVIRIGERATLIYCHSTESFYFGFSNFKGEREIVLSRQLDKSHIGSFVSGQYKL
ncbi:hypothetical protein CJJ07_005242 [Candidozyma auris]|nr:hypothetical protein CJJ07_005242 [[Candida] auris]QEL59304.1 hypothetical protein CJJ09_001377 [[Candida] auris]